jgi:uncharacterized protein GlcG (DUF336 family)
MMNKKMKTAIQTVCAAGFAALISTAAQAQAQAPAAAPAAVPDKMPFDIPYGTPVSLEAAQKMVAAAQAEAKKRDWKMSIAVVDTHGDLVAYARMDGTQYASGEIARKKARTSAVFRRETKAFFNAFESGHGYVGTLDPQLSAAPGGFPLVDAGKLVGGIGCSGGTGDQDSIVCKAGADALK